MRLTKVQVQAVKRNLAARPDGRPVPRWFIANCWDISERHLARIEAERQADADWLADYDAAFPAGNRE